MSDPWKFMILGEQKDFSSVSGPPVAHQVAREHITLGEMIGHWVVLGLMDSLTDVNDNPVFPDLTMCPECFFADRHRTRRVARCA